MILAAGQEHVIRWTDPMPTGVILGVLEVSSGNSAVSVADWGFGPNWYMAVRNNSSTAVTASAVIRYSYFNHT